MKIALGSDGSIELTRGEHITRGQDKSRQVFVEWAEGVSPKFSRVRRLFVLIRLCPFCSKAKL